MSGSGPARELTRNRKVDAALQNEYLTRERVTILEGHAEHFRWCIDQLEVGQEALKRGFWGRLKWLLTGR